MGEGMEQGQLGRQPPGHEPRGTPRFFRDAVVFDNYAIHEGMVIPRGPSARAIARRPALPSRSSWPAWRAAIRPRCSPLSAPMGYWAMPRWPRLSAAIRTAMRLGIPWPGSGPRPRRSRYVCSSRMASRPGMMPRSSTAYASCNSRSRADGGPRLIVPAVWDQPRVHVCWPTPLHSPEDWRTYARHIRREVLNAHLQGDPPPISGAWEHGSPGLPVSGPHCHGLLASPPGRRARVVQRCAEASCRAFFVQTRRTQRFCPAEKPARDSRCAVRARSRRWVGRPRGSC